MEVKHNGEDDWKVWLIDQIDSAEDLRKRESFWQHELDIFQWDWLNKREVALFSIFYLSFCFVTFTHNIFCNRWQWHLHLYFHLKDFTLFFNLIYLSTFIYLLYCIFFFFFIMFYIILIIIIYLLLLWVCRPIWQEGNPFDRYNLNVSQDPASWWDM